MPLHELTNPAFKAARRRWSNLQAKATQDATEAHLNVMALALHQLARCQHGAQLLSWRRLAVHWSKPSKTHQLRNATRVVAVSLHRHGLERVTHVTGLQQLHRKPRLPHARVQPLRQRTRFQPDPRDLDPQLAKPGDQRLGLTRYLGLAYDPAAR